MITSTDVEVAARRIAGHVRRTPAVDVGPWWLKLEQLQHTGSFKPRGAFNRILSAMEHGALPKAGVIAASGGNAGLGVAYAASTLGVPAEIWVPEQAPTVKVERLRKLGAEVVASGNEYADAYDGAVKRAADTG
ncbi:MAG TPA: pyridoxal-phosphate dependent enzyme, partial [Actinopolymorphaceae bacterium]